jgi:Zn-dependent metalloprotease
MKYGCLAVLGGVVVLSAATAAAAPDKAAAVARAQAHARQNAAHTHLTEDQALVVRDVVFDENGTEHVRFDRTYKSLRVLGGDLVVHGTDTGLFLGVSQTLAGDLAVPTTASISSQGAVRRAAAAFAGQPANSKAELVVYAAGDNPVLAYEVTINGDRGDQTPSELHVIVDASTAAVLDSWDAVETTASAGTGNGFYVGAVPLTTDSTAGGFELTDPTRGGQRTLDMNNKLFGSAVAFMDPDNVWGDFSLDDRQTVAVDAQYGTAVTWDYYLNVHGRSGIGNDGVGASNRVHYGRRYSNAFWQESCFCMTYGDGDGINFNPFAALDVAGHEMSHGVTSRTANLTYSGEPGGLNEATSDIFGTMVEVYANNPNDTPDYLIGEEIFVQPGKFIRAMHHPSIDGFSADCWYLGVGLKDVHYSSGIANHFFYLLAQGTNPVGGPASPTCTLMDRREATGTGTLVGIGADKAEKIWYRALTVYMTSMTKYTGARAATLSAAADLFGADSAEYNAVAAAWAAVRMHT